MDIPLVLIVLLALPILAAAVIVLISRGRRGGSAAEASTEPVHRLQTGTAAAQDAAASPTPVAPKAASARALRAASGPRRHRH